MLAAWYDRVGSTAYSLAARITGDRTSAEEVVASVLSTVYEDPSARPDVEDRVTERVLHLIRSRSLSRRDRTDPHARGVATHEIPGSATGGVGPPLTPVDPAPMRTALAALPDVMRRAIELVFFDGLTQADVAVHLDLPEVAVRRLLHEGLVTLREETKGGP